MFDFVYISLLTIFAGIVGTVTGFGMSTIMTPILLLFLPYGQVLFLVGAIHWFHSLWKILLFRRGINWLIVGCFGIPGLIMSVVGAYLAGDGISQLLPYLGLFLILYTVFLYVKPYFSIPPTCAADIVGGAIAGFSAGIFGIRGAIRGMFLSVYDLPKKEYLAVTGVIAIIIDTARLSVYYQKHQLPAALAWGLLLFVPASFLGGFVAQQIVSYIPQRYFRAVIAIFLLVFGVRFVIQPFIG